MVNEDPASLPEEDSYEGVCNICGLRQVFVRNSASLREGYCCAACRASLRYRGQADSIIRTYGRPVITSIAELVHEPVFAALSIWEPGSLGPFRGYFGELPGYVTSGYWPDVPGGKEHNGVRCEDLMSLTFPDASFDLVVTSDIFEHVRKPYLGFAEVHRVLRPGGHHIFTIPAQEPLRAITVERVDTAGPEDVFILEPAYHRGCLVYNDFGRDLISRLDDMGFEVKLDRLLCASPTASRLLTFCSTKRP